MFWGDARSKGKAQGSGVRGRPRHPKSFENERVALTIFDCHTVTETQMELTEEQKRAVRLAARERKRKQREREKQKRIRAIEAQHAASERAERRRRNLHFFGEATPGRNATTFAGELQIHREFLRALNQPDVQPGETLFEVAQRTYQAWIRGPFTNRNDETIYVPGFNRTAQRFDGEYGFGIENVSFEEIWTAPKGCTGEETVDIDSLPELPKLPNMALKEEPVPEPTAPPPPEPPSPIPSQQPYAVHFSWIPPGANQFLNGNLPGGT